MPDWLTSLLSGISLLAVMAMVARFFYWSGVVNTSLKDLEKTAKKDRKAFRREVRTIQKDIKKLLARLPSLAYDGTSPLRLTTVGKAISDQIGASKWAARYATKLRPDVQGRDPYEVQTFCFDHVVSKQPFSARMEQEIREAAYANGVTEDEVHRVLAIELRDKLLPKGDS